MFFGLNPVSTAKCNFILEAKYFKFLESKYAFFGIL